MEGYDKVNLTPKQAKFSEKYLETGSQIEAYKIAYDVDRMTDNAINKEAWVLLKNPKVAQYVSELKAKSQKAFIHTIEDSLKLDYQLIENYNHQVAVLKNPKSTKKNIEVAQRVLKFIGSVGFNAAQDRVAKKLGFYEKDKQNNAVTINVGVTKEEVRQISQDLNNDV